MRFRVELLSLNKQDFKFEVSGLEFDIQGLWFGVWC
jgi:hypothetical protein